MKRWLLCLLAFALAGCAKYPPGATTAATVRLSFTMTVAGKLRTGQATGEAGLPYIYIIALNLSTEDQPTTPGPWPVISPGGNGFVAGNCTHYILWNPLTSPQYSIWQFQDPTTLNNSSNIGVPLSYTTTNEGDRTISCTIDLSQLVPAADVPKYRSVQVNFLTMNNEATSGTNRLWDALGDGRIPTQINSPALIRLTNSQVYNNSNSSIQEPTGDVADPDLDISDWGVTVQVQ